MTQKPGISLRTQISEWLDDTDILVRRIEGAEASQDPVNTYPLLIQIREIQLALSEFFLRRARYTPDSYKKLLQDVQSDAAMIQRGDKD